MKFWFAIFNARSSMKILKDTKLLFQILLLGTLGLKWKLEYMLGNKLNKQVNSQWVVVREKIKIKSFGSVLPRFLFKQVFCIKQSIEQFFSTCLSSFLCSRQSQLKQVNSVSNMFHSWTPPPLLKGGVRPSESWVLGGRVWNFLLERWDKPVKAGLM